MYMLSYLLPTPHTTRKRKQVAQHRQKSTQVPHFQIGNSVILYSKDDILLLVFLLLVYGHYKLPIPGAGLLHGVPPAKLLLLQLLEWRGRGGGGACGGGRCGGALSHLRVSWDALRKKQII